MILKYSACTKTLTSPIKIKNQPKLWRLFCLSNPECQLQPVENHQMRSSWKWLLPLLNKCLNCWTKQLAISSISNSLKKAIWDLFQSSCCNRWSSSTFCWKKCHQLSMNSKKLFKVWQSCLRTSIKCTLHSRTTCFLPFGNRSATLLWNHFLHGSKIWLQE